MEEKKKFSGSVWSLQIFSDRNVTIVDTIFMSLSDSIEKAATFFRPQIEEHLGNIGLLDSIPDDPKKIIGYLNYTNEKSHSMHIVCVFPVPKKDMQRTYPKWFPETSDDEDSDEDDSEYSPSEKDEDEDEEQKYPDVGDSDEEKSVMEDSEKDEEEKIIESDEEGSEKSDEEEEDEDDEEDNESDEEESEEDEDDSEEED